MHQRKPASSQSRVVWLDDREHEGGRDGGVHRIPARGEHLCRRLGREGLTGGHGRVRKPSPPLFNRPGDRSVTATISPREAFGVPRETSQQTKEDRHRDATYLQRTHVDLLSAQDNEPTLLASSGVRRIHRFEQAARVDEKRFEARVHVEHENQVAVLEKAADGREVAVTVAKKGTTVKIDDGALSRIVGMPQVLAELSVREIAPHGHLVVRPRACYLAELVERQTTETNPEPALAGAVKDRILRALYAK